MVTDQRGAARLREWNGSTEFYGDERRAWEVHASTYSGAWFKFFFPYITRHDRANIKAKHQGRGGSRCSSALVRALQEVLS
jgi:hypothetical protein